MADSHFSTLVSKDRNDNAVANPIWVELTDGSAAITSTGTALDVNIASGSVTVTATDLDIRALTKDTDEVLVWANTAKDGTGTDYVPLVDADGKLIISNAGGTEYVEDVAAPQPATGSTTLVERDDVLGGITPAEGDWSKLYCDANGALWVTVSGTVAATQSGVWDIGTVTTLTGITNDVNIADGGNTITVDAVALDIRTITKATDSIQISKDTAANSEANPIYVNVVDAPVSGTEIHDYDTQAALASDTPDNHDYAVASATFMLKSVIAASSGAMKLEVQTGPVASLATVAVAFIPKHGGHTQLFFDPPVEVPVASTGTVRIIRTNREGSAQDVYSTIIGNDIA